MAISFNDMKRSSTTEFDKLSKELEKINTPQTNRKDDRLWSCAQDKAGNGYAVIRFLPAPGAEQVPFVRMWNHGWKGPGGWYIENSRTTLGKNEPDPMSEYNAALWNSGIDSNKKIVSGHGKISGSKRKLNFYSNIYVIKDPSNPENEGKVFLMRYGKKIFDKLNDLMHPAFPDLPKINPFDLWAGATFNMRIRRVDNYPSYDQSSFDAPGPLFEDDDKMEQVWKSQYSLQDLTAPSNFKSYAELKKSVERVTQQTGASHASESYNDAPAAPRSAPAPSFKEAAPTKPPFAIDDEDDDEDFALFKRLADSSDD
jgi:gp32 DNA binding protein like